MKRNVQNTKFQTPKTNKGITLVALVITIIVLLILAGVAINMAINSDGLFGKANEASERWNESVQKEETEIGDLLTELDKLSPMAVEISTDIPEGWDDTKVSVVAKAGNRQAPIPVGFTVSSLDGESTIGGGLVIYEGTETVTNTDSDNNGYIDAQENRNQYVWIPVDDINYMVMCKSNNKLADENGNKICNLVLNNGTLMCTNTAHIATANELCGRLYSVTTDKTTTPYRTNMNFLDKTQTWTENGYREPADLEDNSTGDATDIGITGIKNILNNTTATTYDEIKDDWNNMLTNDFENMATSVAKYGGFYVGRYEIGENGVSKKNKKVLTAGISEESTSVVINVENWYGLYDASHNEIKVNSKAILQSHMIYGSQYDQMINFLENNSKNEPQIGHSDRTLKNPNLSGLNSKDVMNNIYDLEGNNREWTAQANLEYRRNCRGSSYYEAISNELYPASRRDNISPTASEFRWSTRVSLFVEI